MRTTLGPVVARPGARRGERLMRQSWRVLTGFAAALGALALSPSAAAVDIDMRNVEGTPADDVLRGTSNDDRIWAGGGHNVVFGLAGSDRLVGGSGRDEIYGGRGNDSLRSGAGHDLLVPARGSDRVLAGPGRDVVRLGTDGAADQIDCGGGRDLVRLSSRRDSSDVLRGCERVVRAS
ncbi:MAG: hypothetical protein H0U47_08645 [Nocardioidaceae bacterium]|nr:hypothetical protein [Nocardioidaceae bacterium]